MSRAHGSVRKRETWDQRVVARAHGSVGRAPHLQ